MMYAYNGCFAGFMAGFILFGQIYLAPGSTDLLLMALGVSLFSLILTSAFFGIFFRYGFGKIFNSLFLGAMLTSLLTMYLAMLINSDVAQPIVMILIGMILGSVIGRLFCKNCENFD